MRAWALLLLLAWPAAPPDAKPELPLGLSPEQVRARLGQPGRVARVVTAHRTVEQWHYGPPHGLRLVFECPRGQSPRLARVRPSGEAPAE